MKSIISFYCYFLFILIKFKNKKTFHISITYFEMYTTLENSNSFTLKSNN